MSTPSAPIIVTTSTGAEVTRVRDKATGHHLTIVASAYDNAKHVPLKSDALDTYGAPLAPKFRAEKGPQATEEEQDDTPEGDTDPAEGPQDAEQDATGYDGGDEQPDQEA